VACSRKPGNLAGKDVDPGAGSPGVGDGETKNAGARGVFRKNDGVRRDPVVKGKN